MATFNAYNLTVTKKQIDCSAFINRKFPFNSVPVEVSPNSLYVIGGLEKENDEFMFHSSKVIYKQVQNEM